MTSTRTLLLQAILAFTLISSNAFAQRGDGPQKKRYPFQEPAITVSFGALAQVPYLDGPIDCGPRNSNFVVGTIKRTRSPHSTSARFTSDIARIEDLRARAEKVPQPQRIRLEQLIETLERDLDAKNNTCNSTLLAPTYPPSVAVIDNCGPGGYVSSNYSDLYSHPQQPFELHVVSVYEGNYPSTTSHSGVKIRVERRSKPIVLMLSSYHDIEWQIEVTDGALLQKVYAPWVIENGQLFPPIIHGVPEGVPVEAVTTHRSHRWEEGNNPAGGRFLSMISEMREISGLREATFQGCYLGNDFVISGSE